MSSSTPGYKSHLVWAHLGKKTRKWTKKERKEKTRKKEGIIIYSFIYHFRKTFVYNYYCLKDMFSLRSSTYFLRGHNMPCLPKPLITSYGINSFSYLAATSCNSLPDHHRTILIVLLFDDWYLLGTIIYLKGQELQTFLHQDNLQVSCLGS